jgi:hypothetical protein
MQPSQIAKDIALAIQAAKATGLILCPSDFTKNPETQQMVCELLGST